MNMKKAIMALDGGGSNLRILVVDHDTEEELFSRDIATGTNLASVPNKQEALSNIKNLIIEGFENIPSGYSISGIGLSSAGTEIEGNKPMLEGAISEAVSTLQGCYSAVRENPPQCFVTNDIDILLHSSDIAIVAGTGTVGAVKYKDIEPYDNTDEEPEEVIYKLDGNGQFIGDKGAGYWIAKEALTRVAEIENLGGFMNRKGEFVEAQDSYLRDLVYRRLFKENGISKEEASRLAKEKKIPEFVSLLYSATEENGRPFDRAKVGNMFSKIVDEAAYMGDEAANDVLEQSALEIFKNIRAAYKRGKFENKPYCDLLLSGSVLVHSDIVRFFLENEIKDNYPNVSIKVNKEKPVWSTVRYVKGKVESKEKQTEEVVR